MDTTINYKLPSKKLKHKATFMVLIAFVSVGLSIYLDFDPSLFFTEGHHIINLLGDMLPPNLEILWKKTNIYTAILETMGMAFLGSVFGGILAIIIGFLAAKNTTPAPIVRTFSKILLSFQRVTPSLVIILVFMIAVGIGPFAGMLTLVFTTVGMFGKLFSDTIEEIEPEPIEATYATGATKLQVIKYCIVPQVSPSFIANLFFSFDINLRAAIALGIFGGGGIGFELHLAMKMLRYKDALALMLFTIVLIVFFEKISDFLRNRILEKQSLK